MGEVTREGLTEATDMRFIKSQDTEHQLDKILNEGIEFGDNMKGALLEHTFSEGENEIQHGLGYVPFGVIVLLKSGPGEIFGTRDTEWTSEIMFLKCDVKNLKARLFVM